MSKKKGKNNIKIQFCGMNAVEVTGSMVLVTYTADDNTQKKILLDCGLYQSSSVHDCFKINNRKFDFNINEIDSIFISHNNIDHIGLLPRLYKDGCNALIYTYNPNLEFMELMLADSAYIMERDLLSVKKKMPNATVLYGIPDVKTTMRYVRGCDKNKIYKIDDNLSVEFISAGHIVGSTQIILYIKKPSGHVTKVGFTGDIGNTLFNNPFIEEFEPINKCNILLGECTYSDGSRSCKKADREKDIKKLKSVIDSFCVEGNGSVLIPCFALQRTQTMLKLLYDIYGEDESFDIPVIIDSPLACRITEALKGAFDDDNLKILNKILSWKNLKLVSKPEESKACVADTSSKVVLSSSGMMTQGRCVHYTKSMLPRSNCCIITCGYMVEGSLGWKIKNCNEQKTISIDGKKYNNKCQVCNLKSFSSHMQYEQLLNYYKNIANNGASQFT